MITSKDIIIECNIRAFRKKFGYTQSELANIIGVSKNAVSEYENGNMLPSLVVAFCLCNTFYCSFYQLFTLRVKSGAELIPTNALLENYEIDDFS